MSDTDHKNEVQCERCGGSGEIGGQLCPDCEGEGWIVRQQDRGGSGLNVLDGDKPGVGSTAVHTGMEEPVPEDPQEEFRRLHRELADARRRIAALESELADAEVSAKKGKNRQVAKTAGSAQNGLEPVPPASAREFFHLLEKSQLLSPEQLDEAHALRNDPRGVARGLVEAGLLTDWQAVQLIAGRSSFFLDRYKLICLLGRGEAGGVFLGEHVTMNRRVAIKTLSRDVSKDSGSLERFLAEARTIAALDHPNIVRAYSVDKMGNRFYLVMEYVDGHNLNEIVRSQGPLKCRLAADYVRQAAQGLQHGHRRGIIHCDVKPSNLLVNKDGVVKIVGMGLSRLQEPGQIGGKAQDDSRMLDSIDFLAPEQALGTTGLDYRVDVYSLGCTLYFLLTGQPPFPEGLLYERLMMHQSKQPESIDKFRSDVPKELIEVCRKMMAKKPDDRFQSAKAVAGALVACFAQRNPK